MSMTIESKINKLSSLEHTADYNKSTADDYLAKAEAARTEALAIRDSLIADIAHLKDDEIVHDYCYAWTRGANGLPVRHKMLRVADLQKRIDEANPHNTCQRCNAEVPIPEGDDPGLCPDCLAQPAEAVLVEVDF